MFIPFQIPKPVDFSDGLSSPPVGLCDGFSLYSERMQHPVTAEQIQYLRPQRSQATRGEMGREATESSIWLWAPWNVEGVPDFFPTLWGTLPCPHSKK